jgi:flagellar M-ring protein FliF
VEQLVNLIRQAGPGRLFAALGITGLVAAALIAIMVQVGAEDRALLYGDLEPKDAAAIAEQLNTANIPYNTSPDGMSVYVPRSQVADARMRLAAEGLPGSGTVGYEIFDNQDALGATSFVQEINRLRALEGELARTIASLDSVRAARVHLVMPERNLFEENKREPTASIVVTLERGELTQGQIGAIRNLAAAAVPGLKTDKVTLLDESGELLAGASDDGAIGSAVALDDRKAAQEERIRRTVTQLVESIAGPGAVRVQVAADMDFSQVTEQTERFDPDGQVARSVQSSEENGGETTRDDGGVTADNNVPDGGDANATATSQSNSTRTEETTNFEISKTTRTEVQAPGQVTRLSVAVAVDGVTAPGANGQPGQWRARTAEEMQQITALVRSAVGYNEERGDRVEVVNIRFAPEQATDVGTESPGMFQFDRSDIMRAVEILAFTLVAFALVFFVARPLVKGLVGGGAGPGGAAGAAGGLALPGAGGVTALPAPDGGEDITERIDVAKVEGQVSANAIRQVSNVVASSPEQTVAIIRGWMQDSPGTAR